MTSVPRAVVLPADYPELIVEGGRIEQWRFLRLVAVAEIMRQKIMSEPEEYMRKAFKKVRTLRDNDGVLEPVVTLPPEQSNHILDPLFCEFDAIWSLLGGEGERGDRSYCSKVHMRRIDEKPGRSLMENPVDL